MCVTKLTTPRHHVILSIGSNALYYPRQRRYSYTSQSVKGHKAKKNAPTHFLTCGPRKRQQHDEDGEDRWRLLVQNGVRTEEIATAQYCYRTSAT